MTISIYGYFDSPEQTAPAFDPGLDVPCPVCNQPVGPHTPDSPIKTISLMLEQDPETGARRDDRAYFYRVNKFCYNSLSEDEQGRLDWPIIDARAKTRDTNLLIGEKNERRE